jgi:hypothetical protein
VPFDPNLVEAKLALGRIGPEEMPALAWDALEAGLDGPAIRRMAALVNPSGWQTDQIIPAFMKEAGLQRISIEKASVRMARNLARRILCEGLDPLAYSRDFELLWIHSDHPRAIQDLGMLEDQKYLVHQTEAELRADARGMMLALLRMDENDEPE